MKKCFITCGPESSGNHLITNLLISWGAFGETTNIRLDQPDWNMVLPPPNERTQHLVWLRSLPHGSVWPDFDAMSYQIRRHGYRPHMVIVVRSKYPAILSQINYGRVIEEEEGSYKIAFGLVLALRWAIEHYVPYSLVTYEGLTTSPELRYALCQELELEWSDRLAVRNENPKHLPLVPLP